MKSYNPVMTASINNKGVLDVDTVKGCSLGMLNYPNGGCYGLCYAAKMAKIYGYDFLNSVSRQFKKKTSQLNIFGEISEKITTDVYSSVKNHNLTWFRIGVMGDPCHDWDLTVSTCEWLSHLKIPVIVTKHWIEIPDSLLERVCALGNVVFNTSISALDTDNEIKHRLSQYNRLKKYCYNSVLRVVSCEFGETKKGKELDKIQKYLFSHENIIDTPLRIGHNDKRVINGDIILTDKNISQFNSKTYIGHCKYCPDQCGAIKTT